MAHVPMPAADMPEPGPVIYDEIEAFSTIAVSVEFLDDNCFRKGVAMTPKSILKAGAAGR